MTEILSPAEAAARLRDGALLLDVRAADEHRRARIPGAVNRPLATLDLAALPAGCILHCQSGARTAPLAGRAAVLAGGLDAWARAGLPVERDAAAPLPLMRQVQIAAGGLVLAGVLGGALVAPGFYALAAVVGAGLVFAGATGTCGLARVLAAMPWNAARG